MKPRNIILAILGLLLLGGGAWYSGLDKQTRGLLAALPTDRDVLSWGQSQREAAFRAMDRLPLLAKWSTVTPSPTPLPLPAGEPLEIPGIDDYMRTQNTAGLVELANGPWAASSWSHPTGSRRRSEPRHGSTAGRRSL